MDQASAPSAAPVEDRLDDVQRKPGEGQEPANIGDGHALVLGGRRIAAWGETGYFKANCRTRREMRTIFVRVSNQDLLLYAPVFAEPITSTTFTINSVHPDFIDDTLEFGPGDNVRCRVVRLLGPEESEARQRMVAVERIP